MLCTDCVPGYNATIGKTGTVVVDLDDEGFYGVEFDEVVFGHTCDGHASPRRGLYVREEILSMPNVIFNTSDLKVKIKELF